MNKFSNPLEREKIFFQKEEKREYLYEKIEKKLDLVSELYRFVQESDSLDKNSFREKSEKYLEKVYQSFPEALEKIKKKEELVKKGEELLEKEISKEEFDMDLFKQTLELDQKIRAIELDPDVLFLERMKRGIDTLINKKEQFEEIKQEYKSDFNNILRFLKEPDKSIIQKEKIKPEVLFQNLSVNLILESESFQKMGKPSEAGSHITGSIFNIIKKMKEKSKTESTIRHESFHNFLEGFLLPGYVPEKFEEALKRDIKQYIRGWKILFPPVMLDTIKESLKEKFSSFWDKFHSEIICEVFAGLPQKEIHFPLHYLDAIKRIKKTIKSLKKIKDPFIRIEIEEIMSNGLKMLKKSTINVAKKLKEILFVANRTGFTQKTEVALILFPPSKWYKVENLLSRWVGKDKYQFYKILTEAEYKKKFWLFPPSGISLENLRRFSQLDFKDIILTDKEKEALKYVIEEEAYFTGTKLENLKEVLEYQDLLKKFSENINLDLEISEIKPQMYTGFLLEQLEKNIEKGNEEKIRDLLQSWPLEDKKILEEAILRSFATGVIFDAYEEKYTPETIKNSPLWKILEEFNLKNIAKEGIKEYEEEVKRLEKTKKSY